ncbi:hypothetical protein crov145 [Cafeteria roenbergensis virus]|uniref:Uncharacterized protein n=1 Tax=Cafeteria roenbergensis virus (strain BV-PW1) TaxID=693272 RepID=E3T4R5_CROVB|nr:hypothetical protein crov145 [Cafeteria roenbergensis virus BV-PW1]ADO67178.1 hypothetical protein crov145 [Cafeteria roenbergensis virus BV-PW1]
MQYEKLYHKYKLKYLNLQQQQQGGASLIDSLGLDSPTSPSSPNTKPFLDINEYKKDLNLEKPNPKINMNEMKDFRKSQNNNTLSPSSPSPSHDKQTSTRSSTTNVNYIYPLYIKTHDLRPGDRVMKTKFTSDPLEGMLGDVGTVLSTNYLHNIVSVKFDRLIGLTGIVSYVPSWCLTRIYDPVQYRPKIKLDFDDFVDDEDDEYLIKKPIKKISKKTSKKTSKKLDKKPSKKPSKKSTKKTSKQPIEQSSEQPIE